MTTDKLPEETGAIEELLGRIEVGGGWGWSWAVNLLIGRVKAERDAALERAEEAERQVKRWEDKEVRRASCCAHNEDRAIAAESARDVALKRAEEAEREAGLALDCSMNGDRKVGCGTCQACLAAALGVAEARLREMREALLANCTLTRAQDGQPCWCNDYNLELPPDHEPWCLQARKALAGGGEKEDDHE